MIRPSMSAIALAAVLASLSLAGCDRADDRAKTAAPVEITRDTACALDGMILADYPGPKGQVHYANQDAPEFFCDTTEVLAALLKPEQVRPIRAAYVQDMAHADWQHPVGYWIEAKNAWYVFGSKRDGSMGPTVATFGTEADARDFITKYEGKALRYDQIKPDMIDLSGGAKQDTRM